MSDSSSEAGPSTTSSARGGDPVPGWERCLVVALLTLHGCLVAWLGYRYSPTIDEVAHLPAGLAIWRHGDFGVYRVNPPLTRAIAALPLLIVDHEEDWTGYRPGSPQRQEWRLGSNFTRANGERGLWLMTLARWALLPFTLMGGWICWRWGRELAGQTCGLTALTLWCVCPNILAHAALITPDIAAVSCGLAAAWTFSHWRADPSFPRAFWAGIATGLALLSKTYWILLPPIWISISVWDQNAETWKSPNRALRLTERFCTLLLLLLVALNVLYLGYGFGGVGVPLGEFPFYSRFLAGETRQPERDVPSNRFKGGPLAAWPVPVPADYITGIDVQRADFELGKWSYLLGETSTQGWWYYYIVGLGVKVPLGTWFLAFTGCVALLVPFRNNRFRMVFPQLLPLLVPAVAIFLLASSQTGMNRHVRYVFSLLPVLFLLGGLGATLLWSAAGYDREKFRRVRAALAMATVVCAWMLTLGSLRHYPYSFSYFNELTGGPRHGHRVLIDSNLDWGQDLLFVKDWLKAHPERAPVYIDWLGYADLATWGIDVGRFPAEPFPPGWYLISLHEAHSPKSLSASFLKHVPVDYIGYSFAVYRIDGSERLNNAERD